MNTHVRFINCDDIPEEAADRYFPGNTAISHHLMYGSYNTISQKNTSDFNKKKTDRHIRSTV